MRPDRFTLSVLPVGALYGGDMVLGAEVDAMLALANGEDRDRLLSRVARCVDEKPFQRAGEFTAMTDRVGEHALLQTVGFSSHRVFGLVLAESVFMSLAGGLAGVGGAMWGMYTFVNPLLGWLAILSVFAATILGGLWPTMSTEVAYF